MEKDSRYNTSGFKNSVGIGKKIKSGHTFKMGHQNYAYGGLFPVKNLKNIEFDICYRNGKLSNRIYYTTKDPLSEEYLDLVIKRRYELFGTGRIGYRIGYSNLVSQGPSIGECIDSSPGGHYHNSELPSIADFEVMNNRYLGFEINKMQQKFTQPRHNPHARKHKAAGIRDQQKRKHRENLKEVIYLSQL